MADFLLTRPTKARRGEGGGKAQRSFLIVSRLIGFEKRSTTCPVEVTPESPIDQKPRVSLLLGEASGSCTPAKQNPTDQVDDDRQR